MRWNFWMRQIHRWLSAIFVITVMITAIALAQKTPLVWVSYVPLFPLALLAITGIYLFLLPYFSKGRRNH